jgi:hypothetical protein
MPAPAASASRRAAALACALVLAACGTATPFKPADDGFGYAEQRVERDRYRVAFQGNSLTPRDAVETYALYRAAELTVQSGYDYFVIADRGTDRSTRYYGSTTGVGPAWSDSGFGGFATFGVTDLTPIEDYAATLDVKLYEGVKPADDPNAYDAREVLRNLGSTIVRPGPATSG